MGVAQAPTNRLDRSGNREKTLRRKAPQWVMTLSGSNASSICFHPDSARTLSQRSRSSAALCYIWLHDMIHAEKAEKSFVTKIQSRERVWVARLGTRGGKESLNMPRTLTGRLKIVCHWGSEWCSCWCAIVQFLRASMFAPKRNASSSACAFSITHFLDGQITLHRQCCASRDSHQYSSSSSVIDWLWLWEIHQRRSEPALLGRIIDDYRTKEWCEKHFSGDF